MAFTGNFVCSTFKQELLGGTHNFTFSTGNTFKMALYFNTATLTAGTTAYTATGELTGASVGYTVTGTALTISSGSPNLTGTVAWTDFADPTWAASTFTDVRGALLYNDTASGDPAVAVLDFGSLKSSVAGDFTVIMPTANSTNAIIRIA